MEDIYIGEGNLPALVRAIIGRSSAAPPVRTPETMYLLMYMAEYRGISGESVVATLRPWVIGARVAPTLLFEERAALRTRVNNVVANIAGASSIAAVEERNEYDAWRQREHRAPAESDPFDVNLPDAATAAAWKSSLANAAACCHKYEPHVWAAHAAESVFTATGVVARRLSFIRGRANSLSRSEIRVPNELVVDVFTTHIHRVLRECFPVR